jgi:hypothetical protein
LATFWQGFGLALMDSGNSQEAIDSLVSALREKWLAIVADFVGRTRTGKQTSINALFPLTNLIYSLAVAAPGALANRAYETLLLTKALYSEATGMNKHLFCIPDSPKP